MDQRPPADGPSRSTAVRFSTGHRRSVLAPEVVQTSAMDCGPAALKCVLDGHGIHVSYARLRDACQTDVDGTSIDTMESVANQLGLAAEQIVIPADHLLLPEAAALPAIVVVRLAERLTHFVVVWRRHGPIRAGDGSKRRPPMDEGEQLLASSTSIAWTCRRAAWREWAGSSEFQDALTKRLRPESASRQAIGRRGSNARHRDPSWTALGALDAVTRMIRSLVDTGGLRRGARSRSPSSKRLNEADRQRAGAAGH